MDIVEFLRARLDEDAAAASSGIDEEDLPLVRADNDSALYDECQFEKLVITKGRVLREVEAKRRIVDAYAEHADYDTEDWPDEGATGRIHGLGEAIRLLASVYADHPNYDEEWRL